MAGMAQRPGWAGMRAMRESARVRVHAEESDVLVRPGPRMAEGARLLARCINSQFADKAHQAGVRP
jgi:iron complex transport system substrate-binding protein